MVSLVPLLIVSVTKFSILIGSARAHLSRYWRANNGCLITGIQLQLLVIGHLRHSRVNHVHLNGLFVAVFLLFVKPTEHIFDFFQVKESLKDFLTWNFVIDTIN